MENIKINNFRMSFIWYQKLPDQLNEAKIEKKLRFLAKVDGIPELIAKNGNDFQRPWLTGYDQHFWQNYLHLTNLDQVNKKIAAENMIPLRERLNFDISINDDKTKFIPEFYYFPFGTAFVLTFIYRSKDLSLQETASLIQKIQNETMLQLSIKKQTAEVEKIPWKKLDALKREVFESQFKLISGQNTPIDNSSPFTLFTVIQGNGDDLTIKEGNEVHAFLNQVTRQNPRILIPLKDALLPADSPKTADFYHQKRGHAVWFPYLFTPGSNKRNKLSCYHRNQLYSALMIESLANYLLDYAEKMKNSDSISAEERRYAYIASDIIGKLYGSARETYRSPLSSIHIDGQPDWKTNIDYVRSLFLCEPLYKN